MKSSTIGKMIERRNRLRNDLEKLERKITKSIDSSLDQIDTAIEYHEEKGNFKAIEKLMKQMVSFDELENKFYK